MRLEQLDRDPQRPAVANFNSIKVRLEREFAAETAQIILFQFHKGAIRTHRYLEF